MCGKKQYRQLINTLILKNILFGVGLDENNDPKTILLAEDEADMRSLLIAFIDTLGHKTVEAENGLEAWEIAKKGGIDLIISDLIMPQLDGVGLLQKLHDAQSKVPFILLTGFGSDKSARDALALGAFDFLEKPFNGDQLRTLIDSACLTLAATPKRFRYFGDKFSNSFKNSLSLYTSPAPNLALSEQLSTIAMAHDLLAFSGSAWENLKKGERTELEIGFLFRIFREITSEMLSCGLLQIGFASHLATEVLLELRSGIRKLDQTYIDLLQDFSNTLQAELLRLQETKHSFFQLGAKEEKLRELREKLRKK